MIIRVLASKIYCNKTTIRRHWSGAPLITHVPTPELLVHVAFRVEATEGAEFQAYPVEQFTVIVSPTNEGAMIEYEYGPAMVEFMQSTE